MLYSPCMFDMGISFPSTKKKTPLTHSSSDYESIGSNGNTEEMITLECLDCWTMGTINTTLASSSIDHAELSVVFQDVKASFDLALFVNAEQTLTIPIYQLGGTLKVS